MKRLLAFVTLFWLSLAAAVCLWWVRTIPRRPVPQAVKSSQAQSNPVRVDDGIQPVDPLEGPLELDATFWLMRAFRLDNGRLPTLDEFGLFVHHDHAWVPHTPGEWSPDCRRCEGLANQFIKAIREAL